jgi:translation initiation factor IF-2
LFQISFVIFSFLFLLCLLTLDQKKKKKVILVVASNEPFQSQTVESLDLAIEWNVPIIVVLNKIDLPDAKPDEALVNVLTHTNQYSKPRKLSRTSSRPLSSGSSSLSSPHSRSFHLDDRFYSITQPGPVCCAVQVSAKNHDNIDDLKRAFAHALSITKPTAGLIIFFFFTFSS